MTDKKQRLMLLFLLTLFLGGCSLFTDKAAERREMIQIAESTKMERAIKHLLISIDHKAFTSEGVISLLSAALSVKRLQPPRNKVSKNNSTNRCFLSVIFPSHLYYS